MHILSPSGWSVGGSTISWLSPVPPNGAGLRWARSPLTIQGVGIARELCIILQTPFISSSLDHNFIKYLYEISFNFDYYKSFLLDHSELASI